MKNKIDKIFKNYFLYFSQKNLKKLETLYSENVQLIDWSTNLKSKKKVLAFNRNLFKKFKKIDIKIIEKFYDLKKKTIACKLTIKLDKKKINVIDLIYFNSKLEIYKIIAYLR